MGKRRVRTPFGEKRTKDVKVRLTPTEYEELREAAEKVGGLSVGAYVGQIAQEAAMDIPMRRHDTIWPLVQARIEVKRTGNNLNQIAKALNSNRQPTPRRLNEALAASTAALSTLEDVSDALGEAWMKMVPKAVKKRVRSRWWEDKSSKTPTSATPEPQEEQTEEDWAAIIDGD